MLNNSLVPGCGTFADLALRERFFSIRERLDDALFGGFGLWRVVQREVLTPIGAVTH